jgi:hypothetical protein
MRIIEELLEKKKIALTTQYPLPAKVGTTLLVTAVTQYSSLVD